MCIRDRKKIDDDYFLRHNPDEIAFIYEDKQTTYKDFDLKTEKVANGLVALGVKDQDRVAFMDKNSDIFYEVVLGCSKANAVVVGINWRLAPPEVAYILNDSGAKVLFVGEEFFDLAEKILELSTNVEKVIVLLVRERVGYLLKNGKTLNLANNAQGNRL